MLEAAQGRLYTPGVKRETMSDRIQRVMARKGWREADLIRAVHRLTGEDSKTGGPVTRSLSQQTISALINGTTTKSFVMPFLARALGVDPLWLGWGIGAESERERVVPLPREPSAYSRDEIIDAMRAAFDDIDRRQSKTA